MYLNQFRGIKRRGSNCVVLMMMVKCQWQAWMTLKGVNWGLAWYSVWFLKISILTFLLAFDEIWLLCAWLWELALLWIIVICTIPWKCVWNILELDLIMKGLIYAKMMIIGKSMRKVSLGMAHTCEMIWQEYFDFSSQFICVRPKHVWWWEIVLSMCYCELFDGWTCL